MSPRSADVVRSPAPGTPGRRPGRARRRLAAAGLILALVSLASSCAYYNTFYSAKKYYQRGTGNEPYPIDPVVGGDQQNFDHAVTYSKKVLSNYPKSKWVDDAYLMWACALLGQNDPLQTAKMLDEFPTRFPKSPLKDEAHFYLGVAYRQGRKYRQAVRTLDEFLQKSPRNKLAPYAYLERARALMSLKDPEGAAASASKVIEKFPKSRLADRARIARADALFAARQFESARLDYQELGHRATTDDDRLKYLLSEIDCLEASHSYDVALGLLRNAIAHEHEPLPPDTTGGRPAVVQATPGYDRYGRLLTRMGTVKLRSGRMQDALTDYHRVVLDYPKDALAGEAQYRTGYAYETVGDDFEKARNEYQLVQAQVGQAGFGIQAQDRLHNLDRIAKFRSAGGDSAARQQEAAFLVAEQYLFELDKPDRALEEYRAIASKYPGTPSAAKALNAEAWVLSRRLDRKAEADSLFWTVVHDYPATEAQLAARDYLEMSGKQVPADLIKMPIPEQVAAIDTMSLTAPPDSTPALGTLGPGVAGPDSLLGRMAPRRLSLLPQSLERPPVPGDAAPGFAGDTPSTPKSGSSTSPGRVEPPRSRSRHAGDPAFAPRDTTAAPPPSPVRPTPADTTSVPPNPVHTASPDTAAAPPPGPMGPAPSDTTGNRR